VQFVPEMTVSEALALHPHARWVFAAYHIGGCTGCSAASEETLSEVAGGYGLPLEKLVGDLNALLPDRAAELLVPCEQHGAI
jgi:hybrid cluster-associated redox disulfide protein